MFVRENQQIYKRGAHIMDMLSIVFYIINWFIIYICIFFFTHGFSVILFFSVQIVPSCMYIYSSSRTQRDISLPKDQGEVDDQRESTPTSKVIAI